MAAAINESHYRIDNVSEESRSLNGQSVRYLVTCPWFDSGLKQDALSLSLLRRR